MNYPPPFQDLRTLSEHICVGESTIERWVREGTFVKPERNGPKGPLWRWSQVERMLGGGGPEALSRVYFIEMNEFIKIGFTTNLDRRMEDLAHGHPYEINLIHHIEGSFNTESDLHRKFKHLHVRGEWFSKAPDLLQYIEELKSQEEP